MSETPVALVPWQDLTSAYLARHAESLLEGQMVVLIIDLPAVVHESAVGQCWMSSSVYCPETITAGCSRNIGEGSYPQCS